MPKTYDKEELENLGTETVDEETVETEEVEVDENLETDEESENLLFLQEEDEQESSDVMPVSAHVKLKQKLKGKLRSNEEELEKLRSENEELKKAVPAVVVKAPKRPRPEDFDTDEEYDVALESYDTEKATATAQALLNKQRQDKQNKKIVESITAAEDSHIDRAAELINKHAINPDVYQKANDDVREVFESVHPGVNAFGQFLRVVGEGSEKTIFAIGRNKNKLAILKNKLNEDKSCLEAAFFLGQETARLNAPPKKKSSAPAPGAKIKGEVPVSGDVKKLKKAYDLAHKNKKGTEAFDLKRQAKKLGADTKSW